MLVTGFYGWVPGFDGGHRDLWVVTGLGSVDSWIT